MRRAQKYWEMKTGQEPGVFIPPKIEAPKPKKEVKPATPEPVKEEPEEIVNVLDTNMLKNLD